MSPGAGGSGAARRRRAQKERSQAKHVQWLASLLAIQRSHHTSAHPASAQAGFVEALAALRAEVDSLRSELSELRQGRRAVLPEVGTPHNPDLHSSADTDMVGGGANAEHVHTVGVDQTQGGAVVQDLGSAGLASEEYVMNQDEEFETDLVAGSATARMEVDGQESATQRNEGDPVEQNEAKEFRTMTGRSAPSIPELKARYSAMVADADDDSDSTDETGEQDSQALAVEEFKRKAMLLLAPHITPAPRPTPSHQWGRRQASWSSSSWSWSEWG